MANELIHVSVGTQLTQAEFESITLHQFDSQATGDILYASSATQLSRLGIGAAGTKLIVGGSSIPAWSAGLTFADNDKIQLGTGNDAEIYYDGTNLIIDPDAVGSGGVQLDGLTGVNTAPDSTVLLKVGGSISGPNVPSGFQVQTVAITITGTETNSRLAAMGGAAGSITTQDNSVALARLSTLELFEPNISLGASDSLVEAATLYIANAPTEATNNYALEVDSGLARFDGDGTDVFELPADATDPTGGGGAAAGRIPVKIGGVTKYLAYY